VDIRDDPPGLAVFIDYSLRVIVNVFRDFPRISSAFSPFPGTFTNKGHEIAATQVFYVVSFPQFSDPE
jgi:hypothetical protein